MERMAAAAAVGRNAPPSPAVGRAESCGILGSILRARLRRRQAVQTQPRSKCAAVERISSTSATGLLPPLQSDRRIQGADAVRFYGPQAIRKDVSQRLLDGTCQQRTGRHEDDGCFGCLIGFGLVGGQLAFFSLSSICCQTAASAAAMRRSAIWRPSRVAPAAAVGTIIFGSRSVLAGRAAHPKQNASRSASNAASVPRSRLPNACNNVFATRR